MGGIRHKIMIVFFNGTGDYSIGRFACDKCADILPLPSEHRFCFDNCIRRGDAWGGVDSFYPFAEGTVMIIGKEKEA